MMKRIDDVFNLHRAKSGLFTEYESGVVAYIGNGLVDNAVTGFVSPRAEDKVFNFRAICVSAFCEATVQMPPFVACGRAGNGLVVLEPKIAMPVRQLAYVAGFINSTVRWRFNWYRQVTADRLKTLLIPASVPTKAQFDLKTALPSTSPKPTPLWTLNLEKAALGDIYELHPGDFHSIAELAPGNLPIISCGDRDNGVAAYVDIKEPTYRNRLTIAFNGTPLAAKYHPYEFAAKDDVAVCVPKKPLRFTTEIFIQTMVDRERWRYSYYRKCFIEKLRRFVISLPVTSGEMDEDTMEQVVQSAPYWDFILKRAAV